MSPQGSCHVGRRSSTSSKRRIRGAAAELQHIQSEDQADQEENRSLMDATVASWRVLISNTLANDGIQRARALPVGLKGYY